MKNFTSKSQKIGELGEDIACKFLEKHGFSIVERNYTRKCGEIDIIARKKNILYFIEVKSKSVSSLPAVQALPGQRVEVSGETPFAPEENMHPWKMKRLRRVVETYLINKRIGNTEWQFDLLVVYLDIEKRLSRVKVLENIIL
jgi:putative endonuclease